MTLTALILIGLITELTLKKYPDKQWLNKEISTKATD
jgi:hypothetical protein